MGGGVFRLAEFDTLCRLPPLLTPFWEFSEAGVGAVVNPLQVRRSAYVHFLAELGYIVGFVVRYVIGSILLPTGPRIPAAQCRTPQMC